MWLKDHSPVKLTRKEDKLTLTLPAQQRDAINTVVKLEK